jgi:hypothetical protein
MITQIAIIALALTIGLILGYALGSKSDVPVKRTIEQMNESETIRSNERRVINLRAALIDIRNQGIASKSGTARSMASKAKAALK